MPIASFAEKPAQSTVAILYFDYDGKNADLEVLKKGLAQMLISDVSELDSVVVVERDRLQDVENELKLGLSGKIDAATAARVGKLLGAKYLVVGRFFDLGKTLRIDARAIVTETGRVVRSTGASGQQENFIELEQKLATELKTILSSAVTPQSAPSANRSERVKLARLPKKLTTQVAIRYSKALHAIDQKEVATARKELEAVVKEQPDFELAATELAGLLH
jgi:TolB-like protein